MLDFKIPELGENIAGGTVVKIDVAKGDSVKKDQTLLELETDKATIDVPSPADGVIADILVNAGDDVKVGQVVIRIDGAGAAAAPSQEKKEDPKPAEKSSPAPAPQAAAQPSAPVEEKPAPSGVSQSAMAQAAPVNTASPSAAHREVAASPAVRRLARELGVDITQVPGSGRSGLVTKDDIKAFAKRLITGATSSNLPCGVVPQQLPEFSKWGTIERKSMSKIRLKTAQHLGYAWMTIPHVTQFAKADITDLEKLRKKHSKPERKLTITPFLLKIIASALKNFPQFNASVNMGTQEIIYKKYCNIGVAVDTEHGLLVPVIRDIDKKGIMELADELNAVAEKARNRKLTIEDMQGGCFTITNLGGIGGTSFTPIVNWPEVAILGVSRAQLEPVYSDEKFSTPRLMLPLSLSYDHRVVDGADGARFIMWLCDAIKQPLLMDLNS